MDADEKVRNMTEGMHPDRKKHESYFMINRVSVKINFIIFSSSTTEKIILIETLEIMQCRDSLAPCFINPLATLS